MNLNDLLKKLHANSASGLANLSDLPFSEEIDKFLKGFPDCYCPDCKPKPEEKSECKADLHEKEEDLEPEINGEFIKCYDGSYININQISAFILSMGTVSAYLNDHDIPWLIEKDFKSKEQAQEYLDQLMEEL